MPGVFAHPFTYWVGMDTDPRTSPEALAEFNRFYSTTHVHEVIAAHPGFVGVSRYELVEAQVGEGPRWLAVYSMQDEAAAEQYVKDNARPWLHRRRYSPWPAARRRAKTVWRLIWRTDSSIDVDDDSELLLSGTNAAAQPGRDGGCLELYREFAHPAPGCPKLCVLRNQEALEVVWRLVYRPIPGEQTSTKV
jgi:hypothetical protein